jgi:D-alanine transaminase
MENRYNQLQEISKATILAYIIPYDISFDAEKKAVKCELVEDPRRYRRDIKMTSLMPTNLAKISTQEKGYDYVIFKDRQSKAVTEGASSNIFIINQEGVVLTHPTGKKILNGCTRKRAIEFLKAEGFEVKEQEFFEDDLLDAKEAFLTGAIKLFAPIESVNGEKIGNGDYEIAKFCTKKYQDFILTFPKVI